jgi:hypothetical protein
MVAASISGELSCMGWPPQCCCGGRIVARPVDTVNQV